MLASSVGVVQASSWSLNWRLTILVLGKLERAPFLYRLVGYICIGRRALPVANLNFEVEDLTCSRDFGVKDLLVLPRNILLFDHMMDKNG